MKKLSDANCLSYSAKIVSQINPGIISDFASDLRHIKRSKERLVRYALFYLFKNGEQKVSVELLAKTLEKFEFRNIIAIIMNLIKKLKEEKFAIEFENDLIAIKYKKTDPEVGKILLSDTLLFSRRPPGLLADTIIDLLEYNSLSGKEISHIISADKGHISKTINSLLKEKLIIRSDFSGNSRYYTTNCASCPYGRDQGECRRMTEEFIKKTLQTQLEIKIASHELERFDLHSLRNMEKMLKLTFIDSNKLEADLAKLQDLIFSNMLTQLDKKDPSRVQEHLLPKLPTIYKIGIKHGAEISSKVQIDTVSKALKPLLKGHELKKFMARYIEQLNKLGNISRVN